MGDFVPIHHPLSRMDLSDDLAQLEQGLREAGPSGRQLRYYLLRHFSELVQHLTCSLESDVQPDPHADADQQPQAATRTQPEGGCWRQIRAGQAILWRMPTSERYAIRRVRSLTGALWNEEKVFSIHEPHVQWKNKRKAGVKAELGMMVASMEDQYQFIVQHEVVRKGMDSDMIVSFMEKAKGRHPSLTSCSMDRGFYSPSNRERLDKLLDLNAMPKKGSRTKEDVDREQAPDFVEARRQHPAIESAINYLNQRGLSLIRTHGEDGFVRTVAHVVVAANVHRLGPILRNKERRNIRWRAARKRAT